jgi:2-methylcitrate dehydratase
MTPTGGDPIQDWIVDLSSTWSGRLLDDQTRHAATALVIDTIGVALAGLTGPPCRIAADIAAGYRAGGGATLWGTSTVVAPDMAAFANATAARYIEMNDIYHRANVQGGHPSDVIAPLLAVAEAAHRTGGDLLRAVALGYEIYLRFADVTSIPGFDATTFAALAVAAGSARLLDLDDRATAEAVALAAVGGPFLNVTRTGHLSMWKAMASGNAGRAGVFAALLARSGVTGPRQPFTGRSGWLETVPRRDIPVARLAGRPGSAVCDTLIKHRPSAASTIAPAIAAERAAGPAPGADDITGVVVEVYAKAVDRLSSYGASAWRPSTREAADHSIPYVVAAALTTGRLDPDSFDDDRLADPGIHALLDRIDVIANDEFTRAYQRQPQEHRARVTVRLDSGETRAGECAGLGEALSTSKDPRDIDGKFLRLTAGRFAPDHARRVLRLLWDLDAVGDVAAVPASLALDGRSD